MSQPENPSAFPVSNATHTPGPFVVGQSENQRLHGGQWGIGLSQNYGGGAWGCGAIGDDRPYMLLTGFCSEADAHRFAAAPELLEALEELIPANLCATNLALPDDTVLPVDMTLGEIRRALAAIAKAKGGAA